MLLAAAQVVHGQGPEFVGGGAVGHGALAELAAAHGHDLAVAHGLGRHGVLGAGLQAEHVARKEELGDLPAAVGQDAIGADHAAHHPVGADGRLAFTVDLFVAAVTHGDARNAERIGDLPRLRNGPGAFRQDGGLEPMEFAGGGRLSAHRIAPSQGLRCVLRYWKHDRRDIRVICLRDTT